MTSLKEKIKTIPFLGHLFRFAGQLRWKWHVRRVDPLRRLRRILAGQQNLSVVQIGSNDGRTHDPVFSLLETHPTWSALLVEPVPHLFERLKQNYANRPNVRFENVAIAEDSGTRPFFVISHDAKDAFQNLPAWSDQLGSFDRNHIIKHLGPSISPHIREITIPTLPLASLLDRHQVTQIDLLHIDTEGFDWRILSQLDLVTFRPKVILFEFKHLTEAEQASALTRLQSLYRLSHLDVTGDLLCELKR